MPGEKQNKRLQSTRRLVPTNERKRALFSCDRCKLRKTKCNRIQNNGLKYDNITPCLQCTKAGVSCTTSIPRKKRFYGPVKNISLHYKCLLALVTGLFPDSDIYNIEELIDIGHKLKFDMPNLDSHEDMMENNLDLEKELDSENDARSNDRQVFVKNEDDEYSNRTNHSADIVLPTNKEDSKRGEAQTSLNKETSVDAKVFSIDQENAEPCTEKKNIENDNNDNNNNNSNHNNKETNDTNDNNDNDTKKLIDNNTTKNIVRNHSDSTLGKHHDPVIKLPPSVKLRNNNADNERLIMDKFGHTHFIGNFGTASLLNGLCDIIIKRSYNKNNPPTSTQDIRDSSVQTITNENVPVYQYPTHLYNLDTMNIDRFPLINLIERQEADVYVKVFFEKVHRYYFIFNENKFMEKYNIFWEELNVPAEETSKSTNKPQPLKLNSAEICSIYTVWILARRFQQYSAPETLPKDALLDEDMMGRLIDIIKLSLSDVVLTPSIDGIRLLILFSVYLSSIKVRESGYCLMELAAIQAKSLGLHRKSIVNKFTDEKSDVMKRIMWSLAKAETTLCNSFGRASAIPWEEIDISFPEFNDVTDEHFKIFYLESCKLIKIIFEILDYKKKTQKDPLSLASIEKALYFKKKLETSWINLPEKWKDYKSLPIKRYKPKLHIQYHYYYITLTLPMFLYLVKSHSYIVKNDDPFLSLLVCGINSSFKTAEIVSYTNDKGFFNGTIYYDVFYCYNAIMVLTLTFILFKSSQNLKSKQIIDLDNLDEKYHINLEEILKSINLIRKLVLSNLHKIDGTMRRMSDIIETLLEDLGIIQTLVKKYGAPLSNVRNIEDKSESGNTSVTSIPSYRRIKLKFNKHDKRKRPRPLPTTSDEDINKFVSFDDSSIGVNSESSYKMRKTESDVVPMKRAQSHPAVLQQPEENMESVSNVPTLFPRIQPKNERKPPVSLATPNSMFKSYSTNTVQNPNFTRNSSTSSLINFGVDTTGLGANAVSTGLTESPSSSNVFSQQYFPKFEGAVPQVQAQPETETELELEPETRSTSNTNTDINDVLNSMSLNTDLMDALFGTDLFNMGEDPDFM